VPALETTVPAEAESAAPARPDAERRRPNAERGRPERPETERPAAERQGPAVQRGRLEVERGRDDDLWLGGNALARRGRAVVEPGQAPTITVTIGRIEVLAAPAEPMIAPPAAEPRRGPLLTLDDYLSQRSGATR
jgi:hypothetical protein